MKEIEVVYPQNFVEHPETFTYIEPFAGGGSSWIYVLQTYNPKAIIVNDVNPMLINFWEVVKKYPTELCDVLEVIQSKYASMTWEERKDAYHEAKNAFNELKRHYVDTDIELAALFLFLNKTCFNGLYRVNSKGYFNSPIGRSSSGKAPDIVQEQAIRELHDFLWNVDILTGDYRTIVNDWKPMPGDVIFLDPPYSKDDDIKTSGFVGYQKEGWTDYALEILKSECDYWSRLGAKIVITNNDTEFVRNLFSDWEIHSVEVRRSINRNGDNRKGREVIITNY
jgi:DNA adenine methylase